MDELFQRKTISFYRYFYPENPHELRNNIFRDWFSLDCFWRIYVAREGINAQVGAPEYHFRAFLNTIAKFKFHAPFDYAQGDSQTGSRSLPSGA